MVDLVVFFGRGAVLLGVIGLVIAWFVTLLIYNATPAREKQKWSRRWRWWTYACLGVFAFCILLFASGVAAGFAGRLP